MGGSVYYHNYNNCNSIKKIVCCTYETRSYYREYTYIHTYVHTHIHTYIHVVTTVVTASSICGIRQFFQIFLRKKKNRKKKTTEYARKKSIATAKPKKKNRDFLFFSRNPSTSRARKLRVECNANTPDPVDQNELHRLNSPFSPARFRTPLPVYTLAFDRTDLRLGNR